MKKARLDRALAINRGLAAENPTDRQPPQDIARDREIRGDALAALGRHAEALADFEHALAAHEAQLALEPKSAVQRARIAWVLRRHGETWLAAGRAPATAVEHLRRARQLLDENLARDAKGTFDRLNRARILSTLARVGNEPELHLAAHQAWLELAAEQLVPPSESTRPEDEERALAAARSRSGRNP